jgi:four helix bundle protein
MGEAELKRRTYRLAVETIRFVESLPRNRSGDVLGKQLLRSGTSVGANYRAACRGRSRVEFLAKLGIVEEEADETVYWLELIEQSGLSHNHECLVALKDLADQITAMVVASKKTVRKKLE